MIVIYIDNSTGGSTVPWSLLDDGTGSVATSNIFAYDRYYDVPMPAAEDFLSPSRRFQQPTAPRRPYHFAAKPAPYYRPPQRRRMLRCDRKGIGLRIKTTK